MVIFALPESVEYILKSTDQQEAGVVYVRTKECEMF